VRLFAKAAREGANAALAQHLPAIIEAAVAKAFEPSGLLEQHIRDGLGLNLSNRTPMDRAQFIIAMGHRFRDAGVRGEEMFRLARETLNDFLTDEGIAFGDPNYGWNRSCAITLVEECALQYWDRAA
jgi:hypothetical protein